MRGEGPLYRDLWERHESLAAHTEVAAFLGEVLARRDGLEEEESSGGLLR